MVLGQSHGVNLREELDKKLTHTTLLKAKRGNIYDASGSPIAVDATNYSLFAVLIRVMLSFFISSCNSSG